MRISTHWMQQVSVNSLLDQQARLSRTQIQLSTGQRIMTPADNPVDSVLALDLNKALETDRQYQSNIETAQARLGLESSVLDSGTNLLLRARELTVQGLNDTVNAEDRARLAKDVRQIADGMLSLANTRSPNGEYLFGGFRSDAPPFAFDSERVPQSYVYQGDKNQRLLRVGDQRVMADGDSGFAVFEEVASVGGGKGIGSAGGRQSMLNTLYTLAEALDGKFTGPHGTIVGSRDLSAGIDYSAGPKTFDLAVDGGTPVNIGIAAANYANADELAAAINAGIDASSLQGTVEAHVRSGSIELVSHSSGRNSSVTISNDIDGTLSDLGFADPATAAGVDLNFHDAGTAALADLDAAMSRIADIQASVGTRLNALDEQMDVHSKFILDNQTSLAQVQEIDIAEAISRYTQQETALQASQQAYLRVQKLSLFNYL